MITKSIKSPQIFIVHGKVEGKRVTVDFDTSREVCNSKVSRFDTERYVYRKDSNLFDTSRIVNNMNNIIFDTCRKINRDESYIFDSLRAIKSKLPVHNVSVYIHSNRDKPVECVIFQNTGFFPYKNKYVKVQMDFNGKYGYLPLAPVGSEYDSGLRYEEDNGTIWQICTNVLYNLRHQYFKANNYFINAYDLNYVYNAFKKIFSSRVERDLNCIYLTTPPKDCGITKMFMIGLDLRISFGIDNKNLNKLVTLSTWHDGYNITSFGGDEKRKANAMLIKFEPRKKYKIEFYQSHGKTSYTNNENVKGVFIMGKDVESLEEKSSSYEKLILTNSYCTCNKITYEVDLAMQPMDLYYDDMKEMKRNWLDYTNSTYMYNYYSLENIKTNNKK